MNQLCVEYGENCNFCDRNGVCKHSIDVEWIEFEIWADNVQVIGYMNRYDVSSPKPLKWISWDGFECYDDFSRTNEYEEMPDVGTDYLTRWKTIEKFVKEINIAPFIASNYSNNAVKVFNDFNDGFDVKVYVNCSPIKLGQNHIYNEKLGVYNRDYLF